MADARVIKYCVPNWDYKLFLKWAWSRSRNIFKFWEISVNISEMVQDTDIVTMED